MNELLRFVDVCADSTENVSLRHMFYQLYPGQIAAMVGLRGSGKSVFRKLLCGELAASGGKIYIDGKEIPSGSLLKSTEEGIFYVNREFQLVESLPIYMNLELFRDKNRHDYLSYFNKRKVIQKVRALLDDYHLSIDPCTMVWQLSDSAITTLCLLKADYSRAKLVILNMVGWSISYMEWQRICRIIWRMQQKGMAFLLIGDTINENLKIADHIDIIRRGRIVKTFPVQNIKWRDLETVLLAHYGYNGSHAKAKRTAPVIEVFELFYEENRNLSTYVSKLRFLEEYSDDAICLNGKILTELSDNLSIGDNMAMVRYDRLSAAFGVINDNILSFLENHFNSLLAACGSERRERMSDLNYAERKILSIERWVLAGKRRIVMEEPLLGLDEHERQILKNYFNHLSQRGVGLIFLCYDLSEMGDFCDITHLCEHGNVLHSFTMDRQAELAEVITEWSEK